MKTLTLGLFLILTLSIVTAAPAVFADEDEWDDDDREYMGKEDLARWQGSND